MKLKVRHKALAAAGGLTALEALAISRRRGSLFGVRTIVRCRSGHLFTTVWIPGMSLKSLRLGPWRFQRCPVGKHWSIVSPVRARELSDEQRSEAHSRRDTLIP